MDMKLKDMKYIGKTVGLKINCEKTKSLRIIVESDKNFQIGKQNVEKAGKFIYLCSGITRDGGTETDVRTRVQKSNSAFIQLYKIWNA
jgi:hypothetical protein